MDTSHPAPTYRRPRCGEAAVSSHGYCWGHDLQYARWLTWRDQLEGDDFADAGVAPGGEPDPDTAYALDVLWRHLTPGPFPPTDA